MDDAVDPGTQQRIDDHGMARDRRAARMVIGGHSLKHVYQNGFYVILPEVYTALSLSPIAAGTIETVRRIAGGVVSLGAGFALDRYPRWRVATIYLSVVAMGIGYMLAGAVPTYSGILVAVFIAAGASALWHPAALSVLSGAYAEQRGLMMSLHRSTGSMGDFLGPLVVGGLLVTMSWQNILFGTLPLALVVACGLWLIVRRAPSWRPDAMVHTAGRTVRKQFTSLGRIVRSRTIVLLLLVGGVNGLAQGGLLLWLGLYLSETQDMGSVGVGIHVALLTGLGIVAGPVFGHISDRVGRKPVIVGVIAAKAGIAVLLAMVGGGLLFSVLIAALGTVLFSVNSLVQASALDFADGQQLEGSMVGLLWGSNAAFVGLSPLLVGFLVQTIGFGVLFWYVAAVSALALIAALTLPASLSPTAELPG